MFLVFFLKNFDGIFCFWFEVWIGFNVVLKFDDVIDFMCFKFVIFWVGWFVVCDLILDGIVGFLFKFFKLVRWDSFNVWLFLEVLL